MVEKHGKCETPEYISWGAMINRCKHESQRGFYSLNSNGIEVCDRWLDFRNFDADMGPKPDPEMVLTRIDPDGNFTPENCIWADYGVMQQNNKLRTNNTSGVKGVHLNSRGKYQACINTGGKRIHLGTYDTIEEAAAARKEAEDHYWHLSKTHKTGRTEHGT